MILPQIISIRPRLLDEQNPSVQRFPADKNQFWDVRTSLLTVSTEQFSVGNPVATKRSARFVRWTEGSDRPGFKILTDPLILSCRHLQGENINWAASDLWLLGGGQRRRRRWDEGRCICPAALRSPPVFWWGGGLGAFPWWWLTPSQCSLLCPHTSCFPPDN